MSPLLRALPTSFLLITAWLLCTAAAPLLRFIPTAPAYAGDANAYRQIWRTEGRRIARAMEAVTGITFPAARIDVIVAETRPMTSYDGRTIDVRGSYPPFYKKAELIHELGHRLALTFPSRGGLDDHRLLYLFLYDVWTDLYGQAFADRAVAIERRIGPNYDAAWSWALSMTREQRQARLAALRAQPSASQTAPSSSPRLR